MKTLQSFVFALIVLFTTGFIHAEEMVTVTTEDTGVALVNPNMGWTMHFYSNVPTNYGSKLAPSDTLDDFPGLSTVFLRIPWVYIEPQEGKFNWAILDTPAQRWIAKNKRIAMCLTTSENWMKYATPEWVKNAGAQGTFYEFGKGRVAESGTWDPFFDDPIYLEKLDKFLAAVAARYDGNPNIEFIDVGSYGLWGEGHTHMSSRQDDIDIKKKHIDLYVKNFKKTILCINDDFAGHDKPGRRFPIMDYALSKGLTLGDDSILVQPPPRSWYHAEMAQEFWPKLPVILEHEHYGGAKARGSWDGNLLLKSIEDYHASFMSIHWWPRILLNENREIIDKINLRMGYRLQPTKVTFPKKVKIGKRFKVRWTWSNKGVAPCYPGGFPALTLKDDQGGIVSVLSDETLNLRDLKVGSPENIPTTQHESEFVVGLIAPTTKPGTYGLFISVGQRDGTPKIALPLEADDGQNRYRLGAITIE
ncbi:MAG: DUF4832 domain-containing protein [Sedimentisphaerales bacterium]|nr:DUF4832 domain-containing protein [Sedimentisphaerales bacterium]